MPLPNWLFGHDSQEYAYREFESAASSVENGTEYVPTNIPRQGKTIVYMTSRWRMPAHGSEAESGHAHNSKLVDLLLSGFQIGSKAQQDGEIIIRTLRTYCRLPVIL